MEPRTIGLLAIGLALGAASTEGKGLDLEPPNGDLYQDPAVVVQVQSSTGLCWGATYSTATVNDDERFKAKSD